MIRLFHDPYHLYRVPDQEGQKQDTLIVGHPSDYITVRRRIYQALNTVTPSRLDVIVQDNILWYWLQDLEEYEDIQTPNLLQMRELSVVRRWRELYQIDPPMGTPDPTLGYLLSQQLPKPTSHEREDLLGWILGYLLGPVWYKGKMGPDHFAELVIWIATTTPNSVPELEPMIEARLREFAAVDAQYQRLLEKELKPSCRRLLEAYALRRYSRTFLEQTHLPLSTIFNAPIPDHVLREVLDANEAIRQSIKAFWRKHFQSVSRGDVESAVTAMTGFLHEEAFALRELFLRQPEFLTYKLKSQIELRFAMAPAHALKLIRQFIEQLPAQEPNEPQPSWSEWQWLDWATQEYLPYFEWVIKENQAREMQMRYGEAFATWYAARYKDFWVRDDCPLVQNQLRTILRDKSMVKLWLIVDGLTWWEGQQWLTIVKQQRLLVRSHGPALSVLPSITEISKRAMVAGGFPPTPTTAPLKEVVLERIKQLTGVSPHVFTQAKELQVEIVRGSLQPGTYVLFYNELDRYHHTKASIDVEITEGFFNYLTSITQQVFEECEMLGFSVTAFVSSDHGATLIPANQTSLKLPKDGRVVEEVLSDSTKPQKETRQRTRAAIADKVPSDYEVQWGANWIVLRKEVFNLPHHYVIPKRYASVGGRVIYWTHGGATPEEVIVPFLQFSPVVAGTTSESLDRKDVPIVEEDPFMTSEADDMFDNMLGM